MISITHHVSGEVIGKELTDDAEESAYAFVSFVENLSEYEWKEFEMMLKDNLYSDKQKAQIKRLGELLIKISGG